MQVQKSNHFIQTIRQYGRKLLAFIRNKIVNKEEAEDILQEVWYQMSRLEDWEEIDSLSGWLYKVARNKITDTYRKKKHPMEDIDQVGFEELWFDDEWDTTVGNDLKELFWQTLQEALEELPEKQRQVFVWNELEDMTLQEIADMTQENLKTIISRKGYAVKHLRKKLEFVYQKYFND
ncbi:MAG: RNA polymerase sigma factor [Cytophagales bacterium]|nr:MAG: RNA polymerase sigma factor [Cytophagales bacterium]